MHRSITGFQVIDDSHLSATLVIMLTTRLEVLRAKYELFPAYKSLTAWAQT